MEDGEIADSDEESLAVTAGYPIPSSGAGIPGVNAFQPRERGSFPRPKREQHLTARPRKRATSSSSSSSSQSELSDKDADSDADGVQRGAMRQGRPAGAAAAQWQATERAGCLPASSMEPRRSVAGRVNNVWGSVLAEQTLTQELTDVGVVRKLVSNDRSVESYDYRRAPWSHSSSADGSASADDSEDEQNNSASAAVSRSTSGNSSRSHSSDRRGRDAMAAEPPNLSATTQHIPVKERLGKAVEIDTSVTAESPPDAVASYIAANLQEPKGSLIGRVVDVLGTEKALQLFRKTRDMEDAGGIMTKDGSRRRTPGGVFIVLMRKEVTKDQEQQIFALEVQLEREKEKRKRKRPRDKVAPAVKRARADTGPAPMPVDTVDTPQPVAAPCSPAADDEALLASDPDFSIE